MDGGTTEIVIEAAHFEPVSISRTARRHKLGSEASRRFERGTDPQATSAAAQRAVDLLVLLAGGTAEPGVTEVASPSAPRTVAMPADHPDRVAGTAYGRETVVRRLQEIGCGVESGPHTAARRRTATSSSSPCRAGAPTWPSPTTSRKRSSGSKATRTCPRPCPGRPPAAV